MGCAYKTLKSTSQQQPSENEYEFEIRGSTSQYPPPPRDLVFETRRSTSPRREKPRKWSACRRRGQARRHMHGPIEHEALSQVDAVLRLRHYCLFGLGLGQFPRQQPSTAHRVCVDSITLNAFMGNSSISSATNSNIVTGDVGLSRWGCFNCTCSAGALRLASAAAGRATAATAAGPSTGRRWRGLHHLRLLRRCGRCGIYKFPGFPGPVQFLALV